MFFSLATTLLPAVLLSAGAPIRPLTPAELAKCAPEGVVAQADQSFALLGVSGLPPKAFLVSGLFEEHTRAVLLDGDTCRTVSSVDDPEAGQVESVSLFDLDDDHSPELVLLAAAKGAADLRRLSIFPIRSDLTHFDSVINALGERQLTMARVKVLAKAVFRDLPKAVTRKKCEYDVPLPFAFSGDGVWAAYLDPRRPLARFSDGAAPRFMNARLGEALAAATNRGCSMTLDTSVPHGSGLDCLQPVDEFNKVLAGVTPPVEFTALTPSDEGATVTVLGVALPVTLLCTREDQTVVRVNRQGDQLTVLSVNAGARTSLYACTEAEEAAAQECYASGGTCVHDVQCVPTPTTWPTATVTRVVLKGH